MSGQSDKDKAIEDLINQEIIAEGRDALQKADRERRGGGGGGRSGSANDIDNSPGAPD